MKYPKRPHYGCDPLCAKCCDWRDRMEAIVSKSVSEGMKAFWNVVEVAHPLAANRTDCAFDMDELEHFQGKLVEIAADAVMNSEGIWIPADAKPFDSAREQAALMAMRQRHLDLRQAEEGPR